ncbi:MAG: hypothetical protein NT166_04040 [Candidatus Aminicenantes bacterium]|nr:hypothetical protein [Candidatus Aminicenantes bacterium]
MSGRNHIPKWWKWGARVVEMVRRIHRTGKLKEFLLFTRARLDMSRSTIIISILNIMRNLEIGAMLWKNLR